MASEPAPTSRRLALAAAAMSCASAAVLTAIYAIGADATAAITVFPIWTWVLPAGATLAAAWRRTPRRWRLAVIGCWSGFLLALADAPLALVDWRSADDRAWRAQREAGTAWRVVTLNVGDDASAMTALGDASPDVVLLQEAPGPTVATAATTLFGGAAGRVWSTDAAILSRWPVEPVPLDALARRHAVAVRVRHPAAAPVLVVSLRLEPEPVRLDLWSPACWAERRDNRRRRRAQLQSVLAGIADEAGPVVIGGDFNAPGRDALGRELRRLGYVDAFTRAGRGWGGTVVASLPFHRVDQVWVRQVEPRAVSTRAVGEADHRAVVADLIVGR